MTKWLLVLPILAMLASCGEATKTVSEFKADDPLRASTLAGCQNNPGEWATTPNCVNAETATQELIGELRADLNTQVEPLKAETQRLWDTCPPKDRATCFISTRGEVYTVTQQIDGIVADYNARIQPLLDQLKR
jgi:hypothetical protein